MTTDELLDSVPSTYVCCYYGATCARGATCLRALAAAARQRQQAATALSVTPWWADQTAEGRCPSYVQARRQRIAWGMKHTFDAVPLGDRDRLILLMTAHFGKSTYYKKRCGMRPISEADQAHIAQVLASMGVGGEPRFDYYTESLNWDDGTRA